MKGSVIIRTLYLQCSGAYLFIYEKEKNKIVAQHTFDLIDLKEDRKTFLRTLLNHFKDVPLTITYEDYKYLRDLKIFR